MKRVTDGYVFDGLYFETPGEVENYRVKTALKAWINGNLGVGEYFSALKLEYLASRLMEEFNVGLKHESFKDGCANVGEPKS